MEIRKLQGTDSFDEITSLLHLAYKPLADAGMRFYASHQSVDVTRKRCTEGECWLSFDEGRLVGTISWRRGSPAETAPWYQNESVGIFGQFAIEPTLQRSGLGTKLLRTVEESARLSGVQELACDTAESAAHLIEYYGGFGFRQVAITQWKVTNYRSVILSKTL
jgi:GNAT superfamily N-acetyltransferase